MSTLSTPALRVTLGHPFIVTHAQLQTLLPGQRVVAAEVVCSVRARLFRTGKSYPSLSTGYAHKPAMVYLAEGDVLTITPDGGKIGRAYLCPLVEPAKQPGPTAVARAAVARASGVQTVGEVAL